MTLTVDQVDRDDLSRDGGGAHDVADVRPPHGRSLTVLASVGAVCIGLYVVIALLRLRYPYELEWIEGGMVDHVARIRDGHQLYTEPSLAFIPDIYTPLYFYVAAALSFVTGLGFFTLRLVSVVASVVLLVLVGRLTMVETDDRRAGLLAAGLFAACYRLGGAWLDVGRVDTLCVALLFGALLVGRRARTSRSTFAAGALMSLAFLAKQVALLPSLGLLLFFLVARRPARAVVTYGATVAVGIGGSTLLLDRLSDGWYSTYVFDVPARHSIAKQEYVGFFTHDLIWPLAVVLTLGIGAVVLLRRRRSDAFWFHVLVGGAIVAAAYSARLHTGGYDNVLMPMHAELAVLAAIGAHHVVDSSPRRWLRIAVTLAVLLQFGLLAYNPAAQVPHADDRRAGAAMIAALRDLPGPTYLPGHPWYLAQVGQPITAQGAAIEDVRRAHVRGMDETIAHQLWDAVAAQRYATIVVDWGEGYSYLPDNLCRFYRPERELVPGGQVSLPLTGTMTGPAMVWVPRAVPDRDCGGIGHWTIGPNG